MIRACLSALLSHWRRNPIQLFAYLAGLALATALWSGVQAINTEARASYAAAASALGQGQFDQLVGQQDGPIPLQTYVDLRRSGWLVSPVIEGRMGDVRLLGIDPLTAPNGFVPMQSASTPQMFSLTDAGNLFANAATARLLKDVAPVTIDATITPGIAIADIGVAQQFLKRQDLTRQIGRAHV